MAEKITFAEEAWLSYQRKLLSFIRAKVESAEDAEDILNDVFLKLTKTMNEDHAPDNISAWLYKVTKNSIVDYYRAKKTLYQLPSELAEEQNDLDTLQQLSMCMLPMIKALPALYQRPLMLSEIQGKKYKEVAVELGVSLSAVKSRILRGREKLHQSMLRCCTVEKNSVGELVDYSEKMASIDPDCSC